MKMLQQACLMLLAVPLYIAPAISAQAAEITVDGNDSATSCTLADAITAANMDIATGHCAAGSDEDTIILTTDVTLSAALPQISSTITIEGNDHFINGNQDENIGSVLHVMSTGDLTLNKGVVKGGTATKGGGMYNEGTVTLNNSTISDNSVTSTQTNNIYLYGGGIYNKGTVTLNNSTVSDNSAATTKANIVYLYGGGMYNEGTVTLNNSTVSGNSATTTSKTNKAYLYGGGICNKGTVTLTNSTVSENSAYTHAPDEAAAYGGGMYNEGTVTFNNSTVSGNSAYANAFCEDIPAYGGGIYNRGGGTVTLNNSTVNGNSVHAYASFYPYAYGGGIYNEGTITLTDSTVSDNSIDASDDKGVYVYGGGIYNKGLVTLTNSTVSGNSAHSGLHSNIYGGGIYNEGTVMLYNSTISDNSARKNGGGIYNTGTITLTDSTVSSNSANDGGGGIYNVDTVTLINSTVSDNSVKHRTSILNWGSDSAYGGGMYNEGEITLTNSTVSGNSAETNSISRSEGASSYGGGIYNLQGAVTLNSSTISGNVVNSSSEYDYYLPVADGGGIYNDYEGTVTLNNSLISGNTAKEGNEVYKKYGEIHSDSFNFFGHSGESNADAFVGFTPGASDIDATGDDGTALEDILSPLADNGGPTQTHALPEGSPAIDLAECSVDLTTDQRGMSRPSGDGCDAGSFEFHYNHAPIADAGADQAAVLGDEICFDGSNSTDIDGDLLAYSWTLSAWPAGSSAELDNPTTVQSCLIADLPGTYEVILVVNDGLIDSEPDSAEAVTTISYPNAVTETLLDAGSVVKELDPAVFKGKKRKAEQRRKQLVRMINRALALADRGKYLRALNLLRKDVLKRIDGCAISGQAQKNDWIQDCAAQEQVYLLVTEAVRYLEEVVSLHAVTETLQEAGVAVSGLAANVFNKKQQQAKLVKKINRSLELAEKLEYHKALRKLRREVRTRVDGCAKAGRPHKKDWIQDCAAQEQVYPLIMKGIGYLEGM
ncbi:MAG: choice-of-anchor Q domain-containing protein [Candidatus Electrothrix scaldis]|nr:MAG: choice-of-anchor Q domain-containing protein [Candidatus Electrothrix sp. GW3-3]